MAVGKSLQTMSDSATLRVDRKVLADELSCFRERLSPPDHGRIIAGAEGNSVDAWRSEENTRLSWQFSHALLLNMGNWSSLA
jgi:hypothetical protein